MAFRCRERIAHDWHLPQGAAAARLLHLARPGFGHDLVHRRPTARPPARCSAIPISPSTFRLLQQQGRDAFYKGEIARAIVAKSTALGGRMTLDDLASYHGEWVEPAATSYHGYGLNELPPPSQAWGANLMLNILEACVPQWTKGADAGAARSAQPEILALPGGGQEARLWRPVSLQRRPRFRAGADRAADVEGARGLAVRQGRSRPRLVDGSGRRAEANGDTIVLSTADDEGNMVSWVNSNFSGFGSGITVPGYGFILHNRGALFSLDPKSPNAIEPHKRPFNTLSAGFVMNGDNPLMTLLLMGGDMQAQGHAQALVNIFDLGANLQAATDMARFHHSQVANRLDLELDLLRAGRQGFGRHGPSREPGHRRRGRRLPVDPGDAARGRRYGRVSRARLLSGGLGQPQGWSGGGVVGGVSHRPSAESIGSYEKWLSNNWQPALPNTIPTRLVLSQQGRITQRLIDVAWLEIRVRLQNGVTAFAGGQEPEPARHRKAQPADASLTGADSRIDGDACEGHAARIAGRRDRCQRHFAPPALVTDRCIS